MNSFIEMSNNKLDDKKSLPAGERFREGLIGEH
jgi:hypothetical protein